MAHVPPPSNRPPPAVAPSPPGGSPARPSLDQRHLIGTVIGGVYAVRSLIGLGGMATVYEAEQMPMGRPVALKVLPVDRGLGEESKKRFLLEARAAAALSHPNICQVYDFGELDDATPFYAMERLFGEPLSDRIKRDGKLGFIDTIDLLMQALAGLAAAHKKGIVHRDIKPENVFLILRDGRPPQVKLLDFGVSKMLLAESDGEDTITRTGVVMGTPYYMAPEQAFGSRDFDPRMDLWSVGVMFYEAVAGVRPFAGASYTGLLSAIIHDRHKPLGERREETPVEVQMVVDKALMKAREDRYQSATEFMGDLQRVRERLLKLGLLPGSATRAQAARAPADGKGERKDGT